MNEDMMAGISRHVIRKRKRYIMRFCEWQCTFSSHREGDLRELTPLRPCRTKYIMTNVSRLSLRHGSDQGTVPSCWY